MLKLVKDDTVKIERINQQGLSAFNDIKKDIEEGKIENVVVLYKQDGNNYYVPITDVSYEAIGWMLFKALLDVAVEDEG